MKGIKILLTKNLVLFCLLQYNTIQYNFINTFWEEQEIRRKGNETEFSLWCLLQSIPRLIYV